MRFFGLYLYRKFLDRFSGSPSRLTLFMLAIFLMILLAAGRTGLSAAFSEVASAIAPASPYNLHPVSFLNDRASDITGASAVNAPGFVVPLGLTGEGQIVAVADSGLDTGRAGNIHPDLQSTPGKMPKVVMLKSWAGRDVPDDPNGHGTHMAATIAGTGAASNGQFRGVAPGASIYFQAILNKDGEPQIPADLSSLFLPAYSAGARVHVDGWGGGSNTYLNSTAQIDDFVRDHPDFLVVFGAGNSGPSSRTLTSEANSKNVLVVGASVLPRPAFVPGADDASSTASFSSRGPAGDGRIKPELLAPASGVISARSSLIEGDLPGHPEYTRMQGTSMAAAVAGGSSALMREYFKKYMDMTTPSAALVKAALINGSRVVEGGPSKEGFGIINLAGTVIALKENTFRLADEWAGVTQGEELSYTFTVTDSSAPFKATLAWTDPAAEPGSGKALVNDLDLIVRAPDGKVYYGNHFLGANTPDRTNNVEQVYLPAPVKGEYTVRVAGTGIRRNVIRGSSVLSQDFALAWGQPPAEGIVKTADGRTITLTDGASFSLSDISVVNLVDDSIAWADVSHIFPGAAVFRTPQRVYFAARLWRATGVKALNTSEGIIFTEINPDSRQGGYSLYPDVESVILNSSFIAPESLPPGVEVSAVVNPVDQKIRQVRASYIEKEGVVLSVRSENGRKTLYLAGDRGAYRISPTAVYSYEDTFVSAETLDAPFGTGALDELEEALPGMPVRLSLSPSSGEIQYLAVKRRVSLGTVKEVNTSTGLIQLENGSTYPMFPGAPVKKDKKVSALESIRPGDHVSAVLLPDTGEAIGVVAYSSVIYGRAIDFAKNNRTIYLLDDSGRYRSLYLPPDAVIYRWGVRTTTDAIASGCLIRVTTDPEGKAVWQLDIAETLCEQAVLISFNENTGTVITEEEKQYLVTVSTRFFKNGHPVMPGDILPGEKVELEYSVAPPPTGNVLVSLNAGTSAPPPPLLFSVVPLQSGMQMTGSANANTSVYIWQGTSGQLVPVDASGRFNIALSPEDEEYNFTLVAVDRRTGGVTGRQVYSTVFGTKGRYDAAVLNMIFGAWSVLPDRAGSNSALDAPLTRAEAAEVLARLLNWPKASEMLLEFTDSGDIPLSFRPAVAEARARGIFKGYQDGSFQPMAALSRVEAAVVFSSVLRDLGLNVKAPFPLPYLDAADIPPWAVEAVSQATATGLFDGRPDGKFAPAEPITAGEMGILLNRLLIVCEHRLGK